MTLRTTLRPKRCKQCREQFMPAKSMQCVCSPLCAAKYGAVQAAKVKHAAELADRRETRARKEALKTRGDWLKEAKVAVQRFRRLEELAKGSGCMSCGRSQEEVHGTDGWRPGGAWDGGHFLSKGARPGLALEPLNIWLQCKSCNAGSSKYARKGATVNASFRLNLIDRIGLAAVEALEADHTPRHYSAEELRRIKAEYTARARELRKAAE